MTESGQPKDSTSLDKNVKSPSSDTGTVVSAPAGRGERVGPQDWPVFTDLPLHGISCRSGLRSLRRDRILLVPPDKIVSARRSIQESGYGPRAPEFTDGCARVRYEPTPGFAAVRNTRLGNSYEYINEESFKDFEDVPQDKPADEYRVMVTGASVVYGRGPVPPSDAVADYYEVTFRWTIPHIMQEILNADPRVREKLQGKKVRVINAGVPGYVYQNSLMRYLAKLRLFHPDLVVALDGANEVHTVARP